MTEPSSDFLRAEFESQLEALLPEVRSYIYRMIGNRSDAEDILQDTAKKAFERRATLKNPAAFRGWLYRIATSTSLDFLRKSKRWSALVQVDVETECHEDAEKRQAVIDTTRDPDFAFDVNEHISYCFTCVGRSLPPDEHAAVVLREIVGFTNQEAADVLNVGEGKFRHHLSDGRRRMQESFEGLCALVNKEGMCRQCAGFRGATREGRRGPELPVLQEPATAWSERVRRAQSRGVEDGVSQALHELLHQRARRIEEERVRPKPESAPSSRN